MSSTVCMFINSLAFEAVRTVEVARRRESGFNRCRGIAVSVLRKEKRAGPWGEVAALQEDTPPPTQLRSLVRRRPLYVSFSSPSPLLALLRGRKPFDRLTTGTPAENTNIQNRRVGLSHNMATEKDKYK
mmetsp:Transcript_32177/g.63819  ORF Transcript_32177/g.63819 Transcript_32177/m.63819 type:complete len:129 (+) Transcript_32177:1382-1768(+)